MQLVHDPLHAWDASLARVLLSADRLTLAKRRWRGTAADGKEFGFDLEHPLADSDVFFQSEIAVYQLAQKPEPVLEIPLDASPADSARLGWRLGNLHFPLAVDAGIARVLDDPAVRQMLKREGIAFRTAERVFRPLLAASGHHQHAHEHSH